MLYILFFELRHKFILFNLLRYITFRSMAAFLTAFIIGMILGPIFIKKFKEMGAGQSIREDGPSTHQVKSGTPTMGGIFIIISVILSSLLWTIYNYYVFVVLFSIIGFAAIGFYDDFLKVSKKNSKGVKAKLKLLFQIIVSAIILLLLYFDPFEKFSFSFFIPFYNKPLFYWPFLIGVFFYIFTMVAFSNATNLSDGLDGLAAGMSIFLIIPFGIIAYVVGNVVASDYLKFIYIPGAGEISVILASFIGGLAAFLWYNVHPAEIFMGDTGSLAIGGMIATIAIILKQEVLLLIAGFMFVLETVSVVIQTSYFKYTKKKFGEGKRIFLMAPIHHHFEKKGWKETQVVIRFWIISALCALISLTTLKLR
ncbi:MAG: phospho-N-acetylmuramoyl-pentapeptide-transferase [Brevinematia bacterium]